MKLQDIILQIEQLQDSDLRIASMGLKIEDENGLHFFETISELIESVKNIDIKNLYKLDLDISNSGFLQIGVKALKLQENEIGINLGLVRIARNINAFDINYQYTDDSKVWQFWSNLKRKLSDKIANLLPEDKNILKTLLNKNQEYFNI